MNRLIIIGNGFDLAHGLKTKYSDFIKDYWENISNTQYNDCLVNFSWSGKALNKNSSLKSMKENLDLILVEDKKNYNFRLESETPKLIRLDFTNDFFRRINEKFDEIDWVDIEMEYFKYLKEILFRKSIIGKADNDIELESLRRVGRLNKEISQIAGTFENYLIEKVMPNIATCKLNQMNEILYNKESNYGDFDSFLEEFPMSFKNSNGRNFTPTKISPNLYAKFDTTCILNFNYTNTISLYGFFKEEEIINIHGELSNNKNPINLGFGDERDKVYSEIENLNQNEYLRFMKSFFYSNTKNYKNLMDFIELGEFQVQIMGHSCGLSDRTLLNAIFENKHCKSIKIFYHELMKNDDYGIGDNYSEIVKNISRHFDHKTMMRDKIVNKTLCEPLPQKVI